MKFVEKIPKDGLYFVVVKEHTCVTENQLFIVELSDGDVTHCGNERTFKPSDYLWGDSIEFPQTIDREV